MHLRTVYRITLYCSAAGAAVVTAAAVVVVAANTALTSRRWQ